MQEIDPKKVDEIEQINRPGNTHKCFMVDFYVCQHLVASYFAIKHKKPINPIKPYYD